MLRLFYSYTAVNLVFPGPRRCIDGLVSLGKRNGGFLHRVDIVGSNISFSRGLVDRRGDISFLQRPDLRKALLPRGNGSRLPVKWTE
jgi:hypothetical protein